MDDVKLKPCPFCGGKADYQYDAEFELSGIRCPQCHSMTKFYRIPKQKPKETYGEVMARWAECWNRRAGEISCNNLQ